MQIGALIISVVGGGGAGQITHTLLVVGLNVGTDGTSGGAFWQN